MESPLNSDWLEEVERRRLSDDEVEELRRGLAKRPAELRRLEEELALNAALGEMRRPDVATNFTSLVMAEIEAEPRSVWRRWLPVVWPTVRWGRAAIFATFAVAAGLTWNEVALRQHNQLARRSVDISEAANALGVDTLSDFDAIHALGATPNPGDVALITALRTATP
jgi:hypothetical protein